MISRVSTPPNPPRPQVPALSIRDASGRDGAASMPIPHLHGSTATRRLQKTTAIQVPPVRRDDAARQTTLAISAALRQLGHKEITSGATAASNVSSANGNAIASPVWKCATRDASVRAYPWRLGRSIPHRAGRWQGEHLGKRPLRNPRRAIANRVWEQPSRNLSPQAGSTSPCIVRRRRRRSGFGRSAFGFPPVVGSLSSLAPECSVNRRDDMWTRRGPAGMIVMTPHPPPTPKTSRGGARGRHDRDSGTARPSFPC
jgi:hypothetical protein